MEKNPDYSKTIIYKIIPNNSELNYCYIGNTTNVKQRLNNHYSNCININSKSYNILLYKTIRENGGWDEWSLIEIEHFPCSNGTEARQREQYYIMKYNSNLNAVRSYRTEEEKLEQARTEHRTAEQIRDKTKKYYNDNKEMCNEKSKNYYNNNKEYFEQKRKEYYNSHKEELKIKRQIYRQTNIEKIKEKNSELINCECGSTITKKSKTRHERTTSHLTAMKNLHVK
jgi:hypothetical protein